MKMAVFWVVAPCGPVQISQSFRDAYCLHIVLMIETESTSETSVNFYQTTRSNVLSQKTVIFILEAVRT
jgi:hypothetical protein